TFEPGDQRRVNWVDSFASAGVTFYYPYKYKLSSSNGSPTEYLMVLRLAEQYLIRAEAEANLGDSSDAINDLNLIRSRAGLASYNSASNGPLLSAILHERRVELFMEWGHRWFDLQRTNLINSVMGAPGNFCQQKGGIWNPYEALFPIPESEIQLNSKLTQNLGYN
ncbi:MAG TPA: RagB/SusD family nutrient uptake outer membrane protein, partial [Puia sp.]|nr:RagB/SusD family nutrient uptake outer membrane protein [Puia sp.]